MTNPAQILILKFTRGGPITQFVKLRRALAEGDRRAEQLAVDELAVLGFKIEIDPDNRVRTQREGDVSGDVRQTFEVPGGSGFRVDRKGVELAGMTNGPEGATPPSRLFKSGPDVLADDRSAQNAVLSERNDIRHGSF